MIMKGPWKSIQYHSENANQRIKHYHPQLLEWHYHFMISDNNNTSVNEDEIETLAPVCNNYIKWYGGSSKN